MTTAYIIMVEIEHIDMGVDRTSSRIFTKRNLAEEYKKNLQNQLDASHKGHDYLRPYVYIEECQLQE